MLTDDLFGSITLDALCSFIPGDYDTRWVEHEDSVILHSLDQESQPILAQAQRVFGRFAGEIAAIGDPTCANSDQYSKQGREEQNDSCPVRADLRVRSAL